MRSSRAGGLLVLLGLTTSACATDGEGLDAGRADAAHAPDAGAGPDAGGFQDAGADDAGAPVSNPVTFSASDGTNLVGTIHRPASPDGRGVVLVHQYFADQTQWGPWIDDLRDRGFTVLTFDLRGHGASDEYAGNDFLSDPEGAPLDVEAAINLLAADDAVTAPEVALMGASVGANLAVTSRQLGWANPVVALSPRLARVEDFAQQSFAATSGVYYAAGEDEAQAVDCQTMYQQTADPRGLTLVPGNAHGVQLLLDDATLLDTVVSFLDDNSPPS